MNAVQKSDTEQFDEVFNNIAKLYDHAENILKTAYHESITDHDQFVEEIEGLVKQIEESANTLAEDFSRVIESGKEPTNAMKVRVSSALRKVLLCIDEYRQRVKDNNQ